MKKVLVVIIALLIISPFGCIGCSNNNEVLPTISEFEEGLNPNACLERLGLFYYQNDTAVSVRENNLDIDPNKPIVIFTHGMLKGGGYDINYNFKERQPWLNAGYNVFLFRWTQFSDDGDPLSIEQKEWAGGESMNFAYENQEGKREVEKENLPEYSLAEIFGIYYNEMMTKYDMQSSEIRFIGHSMGGQLSIAVASYIKTMVDKGVINKRYMLSRITMLDPYICTIDNNAEVRWLDRKIVSSAELSLDILKEFQEEGIPVEYIHSGLADVFMFDKVLRQKLREEVIFLKVDTSFLTGNFIEISGDRHQVAVDWYNESLDYTFYDKSTNNETYGIAASTPTNYVVGLYGSLFEMEENETEQRDDDIMYSTNLNNIIVQGYAFYDENENGLNDDTYANKREDIQIELYCEGQKIDTAYTSRGGYYKFELDEEYKGKEMYIKAPEIKPTIIGEGEGYLAYTENGIKQNKESEKFVMTTYGIKVINIGII